jgi:hypothetical protein
MGGDGDLSARVVLRQKPSGELVTHVQACDERGNPRHEFYWGHYFRDLGEAMADFSARSEKFRR